MRAEIAVTYRFGSLVVRRVNTAAFVRRCIPPGCVASPSHTPGMLGRRALPAGRTPPRIDGLGASPYLRGGPLSDCHVSVPYRMIRAGENSIDSAAPICDHCGLLPDNCTAVPGTGRIHSSSW